MFSVLEFVYEKIKWSQHRIVSMWPNNWPRKWEAEDDGWILMQKRGHQESSTGSSTWFENIHKKMEMGMNNAVTMFSDNVKFFHAAVVKISCEELQNWFGNIITQMKLSVDQCKLHVYWGEKNLFYMVRNRWALEHHLPLKRIFAVRIGSSTEKKNNNQTMFVLLDSFYMSEVQTVCSEVYVASFYMFFLSSDFVCMVAASFLIWKCIDFKSVFVCPSKATLPAFELLPITCQHFFFLMGSIWETQNQAASHTTWFGFAAEDKDSKTAYISIFHMRIDYKCSVTGYHLKLLN